MSVRIEQSALDKMAIAQHQAWGGSESPEIILPETGEKDAYLLAQFQDTSNSFDERLEAYDLLHNSIFSKNKLDPKRAGKLLGAAVSVRKDKEKSSEVGDAIYSDYLTKDEMNRVKEESIRNRWELEANKQAINAYGEFMSIEREYGEEAEDIYRALAKILFMHE